MALAREGEKGRGREEGGERREMERGRQGEKSRNTERQTHREIGREVGRERGRGHLLQNAFTKSQTMRRDSRMRSEIHNDDTQTLAIQPSNVTPNICLVTVTRRVAPEELPVCNSF